MRRLKKHARSLVEVHFKKREKIVCVGLGKTGTSSFGRAMRILGYNHCSMGSTFAFEQRYMWPIYRKLSKYESFDDFPWPYLYEQIYEKYPHAKFILTRRSTSEIWIESLKKHYCILGPTINKKIYYGYYSPHQNIKHHINLYESHNQRVREFFRGSPNFIELCWEEGHGWEELCGFLGRKTPDVPFPIANVAPKIDYEKARENADRQLQMLLK